MKKIVLICLSSQSVLNFRKNLIVDLIAKGYQVNVIAFDDLHRIDIEELGACFHCIKDNNRSLNPFRILALRKKYVAVLAEINPDFVFTFMLKPNIFGVLAAKKLRIRHVYSMVEGLGDVFIYDTLKWKVIRFVVCFLYKYSFRYPEKVFFLNTEDRKEFVSRRLISNDKCHIINGVGVDTDFFKPTPIVNKKSFLMISRLLHTKGVYEYLAAARKVHSIDSSVEFKLLGPEGTITENDLIPFIKSGDIVYLGSTNDVRPYLASSSCFVLPSYREGLSMSIMEALSSGRPVITNDVAGCRDIIVNGYNGYLARPRDVDSLVSCMLKILDNKDDMERLGNNSRNYAVEKLDAKKIDFELIEMIEDDLSK